MSDSRETEQQPRRWLALAIVTAAMFLDTLDASIVTVALPTIQGDLDAEYATMQWTLAGYALAFGLFLITGGRLGDIFGRKRLFLIGVAGFTVASVVCGASVSAEMLVAGRFGQGLLAAMMVPQTMAVVVTLFRREEWANAFTLVGVALIIGSVSGPLLGGVLTELDLLGLGWRAIFLVNVPIGLLTLALAARFVPDSRSDEPLRVDWLGVGLLTVASLSLLFPLVQGRELGWPVWLITAMVAAVPLFAVFALQQRRRHARDGSALLPPPLFRERSFVIGLVVTLAFFTGISSFFLVLTYHLQYGLGWSVLRTAIATAAWPIGIIATTQIAWRVSKGNGRRWVGLGSLILAASIAAVIVLIRNEGADLSLTQVALGGLVMGFGMGFCSPVLTAVVLGDVPPQDSGVGSGVVNAAMQIGAAAGIALVGVIFFGLLSGVDQSDVDAVGSVAGTALYYNVAVFLLTAALSPLLPRDVTNAPEDTTEQDEPVGELPVYEKAR